MRRAAAARQRLLFCQNLGEQLPLCPPPLTPLPKLLTIHSKIMKFMQQEEPVECELCREAVAKLLSHLSSTWTDHTIALFDGHLCHHADDPLMCIEQANIWWPYIAKIIYNPDAAKYECFDLSYGVCEVTK